MRVLVTGHGGYVGSVVCPMLKRSGFDVVGPAADVDGIVRHAVLLDFGGQLADAGFGFVVEAVVSDLADEHVAGAVPSAGAERRGKDGK